MPRARRIGHAPSRSASALAVKALNNVRRVIMNSHPIVRPRSFASNNLRMTIAACMISIFTIFLSGSAVSATPIPNAQRAPAQLNLSTHLEAMRRAGAPAALAIVRQGDFVNRSAAGTANLKTGRQASLADHWRIASVTKMVTAVIVIQLIREGTLTLDDPVARNLPGLFP
jgi:D-alanyl-D-alanine carboxypeptidase